MPVLKISTYIITSITARTVRLAAILVIMSVSTFKSDFILYILYFYWYKIVLFLTIDGEKYVSDDIKFNILESKFYKY